MGAAFALRARRLVIGLVLLGWGLYALSGVETEVVLDARKRRVRIWKPLHRLIGRAPDERPWEAFDEVTVTQVRGRYRVTLRGPIPEKGRRLEVHAPGHRHAAAAAKSAEEAAAYLALPYQPLALRGRPKRHDDDSEA